MNTSLDSKPLRWLAYFSVLLWALGLAYSVRAAWSAYVCAGGGVLIAAYFAHLLFLRLQCPLLDLMVATMLLASAAGLALQSLRYLQDSVYPYLVLPFLVVWILFTTVRAVVSAELLKIERAPLRAAWMLLHALLLAAPGLLLAGVVVHFGGQHDLLKGSDFTPYGLPLIVVGILGLVGDFFIRRRTRHAAKIMLASAKYASGLHAAATAPVPAPKSL